VHGLAVVQAAPSVRGPARARHGSAHALPGQAGQPRARRADMSDQLIAGAPSDEQLSDQLLSPVWSPTSRLWVLSFLVTGAGTLVLFFFLGWSVWTGTGLWGNDIPAAWGFPIINFVWWIGIGHAGTFISAILLLLEQRWRNSINRFAEAMTLFALVQAAMFPLLHLGRPWFFYW